MDVLRKLLGSERFLVLLASVIGILITKYLKIQVDSETILSFVVLIGSFIVGKSISGAGKDAEKVKAISALTTDSTVTASETKKAIEEVKSV
jgi:hypothetical protein